MDFRKILLSSFLTLACIMLSRADGYQWFHTFHVSPEQSGTICPDHTGRIWVGTMNGLLRLGDRLDGKANDIVAEPLRQGILLISRFGRDKLLVRVRNGENFVFDPETNQADSLDSYIRDWGMDLGERWDFKSDTDRSGIIWCYTDFILYRKSPEEKTARIATRETEPILSICISERNYAVLTSSSLKIYDKYDDSLLISREHGLSIKPNIVRTAIDGDGNIWISTGETLVRFDIGKCEFSAVQNVSVSDIYASWSGEILVATTNTGILRFAPDGNLLQSIQHKAHDLTSLYSNSVSSITETPDRALWVSYGKEAVSACRIDEISYPMQHILPLKLQGDEERIMSLAQDHSGNLWLGTESHGLFCQDPNSGESVMAPWLPESSTITSLYVDSRDRIWAGSFREGIWCKDGNSIRHYLKDSSCYGILEDKYGNIWVGLLGNGVYRFDRKLAEPPMAVGGIERKWVLDLAGDRTETIYAATSDGLFAIDARTMESQNLGESVSGSNSLMSSHLESAFLDSRGLVWMISNKNDSPLEIYDSHRDRVLTIHFPDSHIFKNIIEDEGGTVWLTSDNELVQVIVNFDPSSEQYMFYPSFWRFQIPGFNPSYYSFRAAALLDDGTMLFGCSDGYQRIDRMNFPPFAPRQSPPTLSVASAKVNNDYLASLTFHDTLILRHDENNVTLNLAVLDYTSPFETSIQYRMTADKEWKNVRDNSIELIGLSPGLYKLEISSGRYGDVQAERNIVPFEILIKNPWYKRWWAFAIYLLLFSGFVVLLAFLQIERQKQKMYVDRVRQESERQYQLNEMKLRFFTNISHDFRTPLSLIITPLETRLNNPDGKPVDDGMLKIVYRNAVRLLNLINQILDFRKLEANSTTLNLSYGNFVPFVKEICSTFTIFAEDSDRVLDFNSSEDDLNTCFDKDKCTRILTNLLSNAFKHSGSSGHVSVNLSREDEQIVMSVCDDGPGIPDSEKEAIFERFHQISASSSAQTGTGIGLHIVKEFIALHNGTIEVADNEPHGAVFIVRLPIISERADEPMEISEPETDNESATLTNGKKHILLVEDNAEFRSFLQSQLADSYSVSTASDGKEALSALEKTEPDIIVSDIMMAGMDGLEFCKRVKTNISTSHIPFILLTAKALAKDEVMGFEIGADDYVTKPFHMEVLRHRIRKLIEAGIRNRKNFKEKIDVSPSEITITPYDEQFLTRAIQLVEENMQDPDFSVTTLSNFMDMHRTGLYKKILSLTGLAPVEFIRTIRLKRAAQYLRQSQLYIYEIGYKVGFSTPKQFAKYFKNEFGISPREYQRTYNSSTNDGTR